jgi:hypothetical protein
MEWLGKSIADEGFSAAAANTSCGGAARATSVATRRKVACSPAIRRYPVYSWALSRETASWPAMRLTASSRPAVNAARVSKVVSWRLPGLVPLPTYASNSQDSSAGQRAPVQGAH